MMLWVVGCSGMYRILLPVDDDVDRAAAQARYVLSLPGGTDEVAVTVAHAYREEAAPPGSGGPIDEESPGVTEAVDRLSAAGIEVEQTELYIPVAEAIVDFAAEVDADEIVVARGDRSPAGKALFGSVTQSVALDAPVPVTIVGVE